MKSIIFDIILFCSCFSYIFFTNTEKAEQIDKSNIAYIVELKGHEFIVLKTPYIGDVYYGDVIHSNNCKCLKK